MYNLNKKSDQHVCVLPPCCWRQTQWCRSHWGCCWSCYSGSLGLSRGRCYTQSLKQTHTNQIRTRTYSSLEENFLISGQLSVCASLTCHVERALLGGSDGAVSAAQQRAAPPLAYLLLQPGAQLQVGLRGWKEDGERRTIEHDSFIQSLSEWRSEVYTVSSFLAVSRSYHAPSWITNWQVE